MKYREGTLQHINHFVHMAMLTANLIQYSTSFISCISISPCKLNFAQCLPVKFGFLSVQDNVSFCTPTNISKPFSRGQLITNSSNGLTSLYRRNSLILPSMKSLLKNPEILSKDVTNT